jgi:16S rRNA processing protein RimM
VKEVLETGASEVLIVERPEQSDALIPMIRDVVRELDFAGGRVVVRLLEGLI